MLSAEFRIFAGQGIWAVSTEHWYEKSWALGAFVSLIVLLVFAGVQFQAGELESLDLLLSGLTVAASWVLTYLMSETIATRRKVFRKLEEIQQEQDDLLELTRTNSKYNDLTQRALELNSTNSRIVVLGGITTVLNKIVISEAQKEIKFEGEHIALASYVQWWERLSTLQKVMARDGKKRIEVFVTQSTPIYLWNPDKNPLQYEMVEAQRQFCEANGRIARILVHQSESCPAKGEVSGPEFLAEQGEYQRAFKEMRDVGADVFYIACKPTELSVDRRKDFMTCETPVLASLEENREVVSYLWETDASREKLERGILHFGKMPEPGLMQKWYDVFGKILARDAEAPGADCFSVSDPVPDFIAARILEFGQGNSYKAHQRSTAAQ